MNQTIPIKKYRAGTVTATIWENQVPLKKGKYNTIKIVKNKYNKENEEWEEGDVFLLRDLPDVELVSKKAYEYLKTKGEE